MLETNAEHPLVKRLHGSVHFNKTIIHPAGPVASAVLALAERQGATGRQVVDAMVLGIDVACRIGNVMYPDHYDRGWHITGSTGMLVQCCTLSGT